MSSETKSPQPPAEAHCATCSCVPGMTPAVRFDTTPAEKEGAVRDHLIRMGWTPPAEAQPVACAHEAWEESAGWNCCVDCGHGWASASPPSAPVGVEGLVVKWKKESESLDIHPAGLAARRVCAIELEHALSRQPAAVDGVAANSAVAAIQFALKDPEGMTFLRLWNEGDFDTLRREWPDAPVEVYIDAEDYARANVAHATAAKDAEIEALRAEVATWEGLHASEVQVRQRWQARAERLAEALRDIESRPWNGVRPIQIASRAALRDHDQEGGNP